MLSPGDHSLRCWIVHTLSGANFIPPYEGPVSIIALVNVCIHNKISIVKLGTLMKTQFQFYFEIAATLAPTA